ncbi:MAG: SufD family Fe-S cluster assembly protein [Acidilobaceae archaeon]
MSSAREAYARLIEELPFQYIADTPTVKYYTDWRLFENKFNLPYSTREFEAPSIIAHIPFNIVLGLNHRILNIPSGVVVNELRDGVGPIKPMSIVHVNSKILAYHAYRWNTGVSISIEDGASFGNLYILSLGGDAYLGHHIVLSVGKGAVGDIYIIDNSRQNSFKTLVLEGVIGRDARIGFHILTLHSTKSAVFNLNHIIVDDGAEVNSKSLVLGGEMSRVQVDYVVRGENAKLKAIASTASKAENKTDFILNSFNLGSKSEVNITGRGAVLSKGYLALRGSAIIGEEAKQASSEIEFQVVIMGDEARGFAVPVLEIHSGDVAKANHAAGISHILEEQRFYLKSRGLSDSDIERILISSILAFSQLTEDLGIDPMSLLEIY